VSLEIKTSVLQPRRNTYANVAERLGADKPATRYEEGTFDIQPTDNFHFRPTWDSSRELYDKNLTKIKMEDWYSYRDPRQYYYGTYTIARSRMMEAQEKNFSFVEKRNLLDSISDEWKEKVGYFFLPLRHYEWGANMNNSDFSDRSYGASVSQVGIFAAMDRLGIAQIISRVGLLLDGNSGTSLTKAKDYWLEDEAWQPIRKMVEDSFVLDDWFELHIAQNFCMDAIVYGLTYDAFDAAIAAHNGAALSMLNEFMVDWYAEEKKWADNLLKVCAAESDENKALISDWVKKWRAQAEEAFTPLAQKTLGEEAAAAAFEAINADLDKRAKKAGLEL